MFAVLTNRLTWLGGRRSGGRPAEWFVVFGIGADGPGRL